MIDDLTIKVLNKNIYSKDLLQLTAEIDKELFTLFLQHQPPGDLKENKMYNIDLELCGHTHNGQLFPFNFLVKNFFPYITGLHKIDNNFLYISKGTGTWGPPMRLFAPPEVTWIKVKN